MSTASRKQKGRLLQKTVVKSILETFPQLSERDVASRPMGSQGTDVMLSEKAFSLFPFAVECKAQERNKALLDMWSQAFENTGKDGYTMLVLSANRSPTLAIIDLDVFMNFIKKATYEPN